VYQRPCIKIVIAEINEAGGGKGIHFQYMRLALYILSKAVGLSKKILVEQAIIISKADKNEFIIDLRVELMLEILEEGQFRIICGE
jgi:hypothetical protein